MNNTAPLRGFAFSLIVLGTFLGLVFVTSFGTVDALPVPTPSPLPSIAPPAFGPPPATSPPSDPEGRNAAPVNVSRPNPAPILPPPPAHPVAGFTSGRPDQQRIARAFPTVVVWRSTGELPQRVPRRGLRFDRILLTGNDPATLVLQFHPLLAGKPITINPGPEIVLQPSNGILTIGPAGELALQIQIQAPARKGKIDLYVDGVPLELQVARAPLSRVAARETAGTGAGQ